MGTSIDPIEYDVTELRELARVRGDRYVVDGFLWSELPDSFPPVEWHSGPERSVAWSGSLEERQKPYLRRVPDGPAGRRVAREWIRGLVERAGSDAAVEALSYYESLGWLTEAVREELEGFLLAVGYRAGGSIDDLARADHVESLARTARLAQLADSTGEPDPAPVSRSRSPPDPDGEPPSTEAPPVESEPRAAPDGDGGWVWGGPTGVDAAPPTDRDGDGDRDTADEAGPVETSDAPPDVPPDESSEVDTSDEDDDATVCGFRFGAPTE